MDPSQQTSGERLTADELLQVVIGVVLLDAAWRFLGLFPGYIDALQTFLGIPDKQGFRAGADIAYRLSQVSLILWVATRVFRKSLESVGLNRSRWAADLAVGAAVVALIGAVVLAARWAVSAAGQGDLFDLLGLRGGRRVGRLRWAALLEAGAGPLAEDLFFWGVLYNGLRAVRAPLKAAAWVGIPYILLHWHPEASWLILVDPAVGTVLFVSLFEWRRSILATLPVHCSANLAILLINRGVLFPAGS